MGVVPRGNSSRSGSAGFFTTFEPTAGRGGAPAPCHPRSRAAPRPFGRSLSDLGVIVLATCVVVGAFLPARLPLVPAAGALAVGLVARRPWLLWLAALALSSSLAARAIAGSVGLSPRPYRGVVTLSSDPRDLPWGVEAEVTGAGHRLELEASEGMAWEVRDRLAGERLTVDGRIEPLSGSQRYLRWRHVVGRLVVDDVEFAGSGTWPWRLANRVHRALSAAAQCLPAGERALYTGFLVGDTRGQPVEVASDMQASGLGHLLVVSGENVAFLLVLAAPLLRRLPIGVRWLATSVLLMFFAVVTRFEPSVLRAVVMAGLAAMAASAGRPASGLRLLGLAVAALVLLDPLLVRQVGFQLSVAATLGLVVLARPIAAALPGPRSLATAIATTLAAQLGVAPLTIATFGSLPVAALPANLLAAPAAALVLVWGLPAGLVAAPLGQPWANVLQWPTHVLVAWVAWVARTTGALPLGQLRGGELAALAAGVGAVAAGYRWRRRWLGRTGAAVSLFALLLPAWQLRQSPSFTDVASGALWRRGGAAVLVLRPGIPSPKLFDELHRAGVRRFDLVVAPSGGASAASTVLGLRQRWGVARVWAPTGNQIRGAGNPASGTRLRLGGLEVDVVDDQPRLTVEVRADGGDSARMSRENAGVGSLRGARARSPPL